MPSKHRIWQSHWENFSVYQAEAERYFSGKFKEVTIPLSSYNPSVGNLVFWGTIPVMLDRPYGNQLCWRGLMEVAVRHQLEDYTLSTWYKVTAKII